jgi:hypothetical protein
MKGALEAAVAIDYERAEEARAQRPERDGASSLPARGGETVVRKGTER